MCIPAASNPRPGRTCDGIDGILHRAFRANAKTLHALGFQVLGISSQEAKAQLRVMINNRLEHQMLSDPHLLLARGLGLPTFATNHGCWYERTFLVALRGRIAWVQFPVREPGRAPAQAIAWIRTHDTTHTSGWPDAS